MKPNEYRNLTDAELSAKLKDLKSNLFATKMSYATRQSDNPMQINLLKKDIARVQTIIRERELGINQVKKS
ncbi:MAG: 50S ribosomal protein L29 [Clostridia bacterium]|nr:50S ribosomal protein L29 [Clostridia bacterium]